MSVAATKCSTRCLCCISIHQQTAAVGEKRTENWLDKRKNLRPRLWFLTFCVFFPLGLCPFCFLSPVLHCIHTYAHSTHPHSVYSPPLSHHYLQDITPLLALSFFPPFPQLPCYFSLSTSPPPPFLPAPPLLSLALHLGPAWCVVIREGVLTLGLFSTSVHSCWRPCGVLWGRGLLVVECGSPTNTLIQNTNLETSEKRGEAAGGGSTLPLFYSIHPSHLQVLSFFLSSPRLCLCSPPSVCLSAYIKYTDSG